jgi:hypothetical protein
MISEKIAMSYNALNGSGNYFSLGNYGGGAGLQLTNAGALNLASGTFSLSTSGLYLGSSVKNFKDLFGKESINLLMKVGSYFGIDSNGTLYSTNGEFSGKITGGSINIGSNFSVSSDGILKATGAQFSGTITAAAGSTIGGWTIKTNSISNGTTSFNSSNGSLNSATITGGSLSIGNDIYYLDMGEGTNHPACSGLNVGSKGISFKTRTGDATTGGISNCHSIGGNNG